jgi:hypothetical protein
MSAVQERLSLVRTGLLDVSRRGLLIEIALLGKLDPGQLVAQPFHSAARFSQDALCALERRSSHLI